MGIEVPKPRRRAVAILVVAVAAACACACNARVNQFSATPRHICPSESVAVSWDVAGSATLSASPPLPGIANGEVPATGSVVVAPTSTTDVVLHVTRSASPRT